MHTPAPREVNVPEALLWPGLRDVHRVLEPDPLAGRRVGRLRDTARAMSAENVAVMEQAYAAITRKDLAEFLRLSHPEIKFRSLIAEAEGHTFHGHDGVRQWWDAVIQSLAVQPRPERIEGFRDRGITRLRLAGRVAGVEVPQTMWMSWRVRDGLIVWWETFRTEGEALEAAGLSE